MIPGIGKHNKIKMATILSDNNPKINRTAVITNADQKAILNIKSSTNYKDDHISLTQKSAALTPPKAAEKSAGFIC